MHPLSTHSTSFFLRRAIAFGAAGCAVLAISWVAANRHAHPVRSSTSPLVLPPHIDTQALPLQVLPSSFQDIDVIPLDTHSAKHEPAPVKRPYLLKPSVRVWLS